MKSQKLQLVTIISEVVLLEKLQADLTALGATGLTVTEVRGEGSRQANAAVVPGDKIKIECIVAAELATEIFDFVAREFFEHYSLIAYAAEVSVIRGDKFVPKKS